MRPVNFLTISIFVKSHSNFLSFILVEPLYWPFLFHLLFPSSMCMKHYHCCNSQFCFIFLLNSNCWNLKIYCVNYNINRHIKCVKQIIQIPTSNFYSWVKIKQTFECNNVCNVHFDWITSLIFMASIDNWCHGTYVQAQTIYDRC